VVSYGIHWRSTTLAAVNKWLIEFLWIIGALGVFTALCSDCDVNHHPPLERPSQRLTPPQLPENVVSYLVLSILIAAIFLAAGALLEKFSWTLTVLVGSVIGLFVVRNLWFGGQSEEWLKCQGIIVSSALGVSTGQDGTDYAAMVRYVYEVEGRNYFSTRIAFSAYGGSADSRYSKSGTQKILNRYPEGGDVTVYFNPTRPHIAVLEPGTSSGSVFVAVLVPIIAFAIQQDPLVPTAIIGISIAACASGLKMGFLR